MISYYTGGLFLWLVVVICDGEILLQMQAVECSKLKGSFGGSSPVQGGDIVCTHPGHYEGYIVCLSDEHGDE